MKKYNEHIDDVKHLDNYLSFNEKLIINDILNEDMKNIKSKVLSYLGRGVLTATILLTLLGNLNAQDKKEVLDVVKKENPELYQEVSISGKWTSYKQEQTIEFNNTQTFNTLEEKTSVIISNKIAGDYLIKIRYEKEKGADIVIRDNSIIYWSVIGNGLDIDLHREYPDMEYKIIELTNDTLIFEVSMVIPESGSKKIDRFFCKKEQLAHLQL